MCIDPSKNLGVAITRPEGEESFYEDSRVDLFKVEHKKPSGRVHIVTAKLFRGAPHNVPDEDRQAFTETIKKYVSQWSRNTHPNMVSVLGFTLELGHLPAVITLKQLGNVVDFLKNPPALPGFNRAEFIKDISEALRFVHTLDGEICHGNVRANNILINEMGKALLSDSGLSAVLPSDLSWRWRPHSVFIKQMNDIPIVLTQRMDIYALGMTIIEIYTEEVPFPNLRDGPRTIYYVFNHGFPKLEQPLTIDDELWKIVNDCCTVEGDQRPAIGTVVERLADYVA